MALPLPDLPGFELFDVQHLGAIASIVLAVVLLSAALSMAAKLPGGAASQQAICRFWAILLILTEVLGQAWSIVEGSWDIRQSLPLHLCDLGTLVTAIALWTVGSRPSGTVGESTTTPSDAQQLNFELAYYWSLGGSLQAVLTPEISQPCPSPAFVQHFLGHGGTIVAVLAMALGLGRRLRSKSWWRVWLLTNVLATVVGLINLLLGSNYMYLCGPPACASLYDWLGPWPWSLVSLEVLALGVMFLLYWPSRVERRL